MVVKTLDELVAMLRAEMGISVNESMGLNMVQPLYHVLARIQRDLYNEYDWPQFIVERDEQLLAGERYYTFNADVDYDRIYEAKVKWNEIWIPIGHGIEPRLYNIYDSEQGVTAEPVQFWRHYELNQFEVWPIPSAPITLRWRCIRQLPPLIAGTDRCALDADLLVLTAAAELLARDGKKDAPFKQSKAERKLAQLKSNNQKNKVFSMGQNNPDPSGGRINYYARLIGPRQ